jgi:protein-tyrosine phosphatase
MSILDTLTSRALALLGLDLDFSVSLRRDPFNPITEDLYLGARPTREQVPKLQEAGVTHVVSCLDEDDRPKVAFLQEHFHPLFLPMRDGMQEDITSVLPSFFDFVRAARDDHSPAKVLVHCEVGVSRSATLAIALLMTQQRRRFFDAYRDVRTKRPEILPNIGFASQLQRLELDMHPRAPADQGVSSLARYLREICNAPVDIETLQTMLHDHDYDAVRAIRAIFGDEIPRVIQGVRW